MAFDLNKKGDEKKKFDLSKSEGSTSKFDLTKEKGDTPSNGDGKKKSPLWIFALLGVVALAIGVWYFTSQSKPGNSVNESTAQTTPVTDNTAATPSQSDTAASSAPNAANPETNTNTEASPNSTTASNNTPATSTTNNAPPSNNSTSPNRNTSSANSGNNSSNPSVTTSSLNNKIPASFVSGSSALNTVDDKLVSDLINYLSKNANSKLTINGYSSSEGDITFNQWLSQKRANVFKDYLISKGVSSNKVVASGKGIENPIASNDTDEGRMKNRRVEIVLQ